MKTWDDIERAALHEPILHQLVTLVERGDYTREQGLIAAVLGLVAIKDQQHARILELLNTRVPSIVNFQEIPELYDVARQVSHEAGFPWIDPRTGITYPPPLKP